MKPGEFLILSGASLVHVSGLYGLLWLVNFLSLSGSVGFSW